MSFDWINFIHAEMLLKNEGCPLEVLYELRLVVINAIRSGRLTKNHLTQFDLRINTTSKQISNTYYN